jgi:hypothetical protein
MKYELDHKCYRYYVVSSRSSRYYHAPLYPYDDPIPDEFKEKIVMLDAARNGTGEASIPGIGHTSRLNTRYSTIFYYYL